MKVEKVFKKNGKIFVKWEHKGSYGALEVSPTMPKIEVKDRLKQIKEKLDKSVSISADLKSMEGDTI